MLYFRKSSIEFGHQTEAGALYRKTRMEQNRPDPALKQPRRFEVLFLSLQSNLYVTALTIKRPPSIKRPVFKIRIFRLYKRCICSL